VPRIRRVVVKLTGKLFDDRSRTGVLREVAEVISRKASQGFRLAVVVGGGRRARDYIELGRDLGLSEGVLDMLGIEVSRVNALLLTSLVGSAAYLPIPRSVEEFLRAWSTGKVVVLGGLQPGQSTNAVAALVAELVGADLLVNATDVAGIYDSNPKENPNARLLKEVKAEVLEGMLRSEELAGLYELFDRVAMNIVRRSRVPLVFLSAYDVRSLEGAIEGGEFTGTRVVY
jgi:uridylate kinase